MSPVSVIRLGRNNLLLIDLVLSRLCEGWSQEVILESVMIADSVGRSRLDDSVKKV